jgi:hypothetical protein
VSDKPSAPSAVEVEAEIHQPAPHSHSQTRAATPAIRSKKTPNRSANLSSEEITLDTTFQSNLINQSEPDGSSGSVIVLTSIQNQPSGSQYKKQNRPLVPINRKRTARDDSPEFGFSYSAGW